MEKKENCNNPDCELTRKGIRHANHEVKSPKRWSERKFRCKIGFHVSPDNFIGAYPYTCKLCGSLVNEPSDADVR